MKQELELIKGKPYMVKHEHNKQAVRRIFKGTEKRFDEILCYVFTGKVSKKVSVEVKYGLNYDHANDEGVAFWHWRGAKHPPSEISIPFYNLKSIDLPHEN